MYKEELSIVYDPTHLMLADDSTNLLQVAFFHNFRDIIMGRVSPFTLLENTFSYTIKEHIGKHIQ